MDAWVDRYAKSHQNPINRVFHTVWHSHDCSFNSALSESLLELKSLEQRKHCKCRNCDLRSLQFLRVNKSLQGARRDRNCS
jgi:hypothetical protein